MRPDITPYELIRHLANKDSQTGDIVGLLGLMKEPTTPKELAEQHPVNQKTVHEVTDLLEPWAVERSKNGVRQITTAGETARRAYREAAETIDSEHLAWLAWSENRGEILNKLRANGTATAKELSENEENLTKRTIRRNFDEFADRDWITCEEQSGNRTIVAGLTMDGERKSRVFDNLLEKIVQVIDKSPCLRDLGLECADIPLKALADADIEEATPANPLEIEKRVRRLSDTDFQHFRALRSYWNGETTKAYYPAVADGKQFKVITPPLGLDALPTDPEEVECVVGGLRAENYQWHMHPGELPCSLAILDADQMVVGPRDSSTANDVRTGAMFSHNDELVEWAMNMYESHRQQARDPFDVSVGFNISVTDLIELLHNRYLAEDDATPSNE